MSAIEWKPATSQEVSQLLTENYRGPRHPVRIIGGETTPVSPGVQSSGTASLWTSGLHRVVDYPARDMTITVEAGLTISALQKTLHGEQQQLPIDVPQADRATIGGAIACNVSGPGRFGYGTFRDYVLGISAVDGQGRLFSAGGRVVKNVAGYDLCKLLIGSGGSLGVITQVTLKLVPQSPHRCFLILGFRDAVSLESALEILNLSSTRPVVQDVLNAAAVRTLNETVSLKFPEAPYLLCLGYAGTSAETEWQFQTAVSELQSLSYSLPQKFEDHDAEIFWKSLTEFQVSRDQSAMLRASVLPSQVSHVLDQWSSHGLSVQGHAGNGIVFGHGPENAILLPRPAGDDNQSLLLTTAGGEIRNVSPRRQLIHTADEIQRRLKATFDPAGVFCPGSMSIG